MTPDHPASGRTGQAACRTGRVLETIRAVKSAVKCRHQDGSSRGVTGGAGAGDPTIRWKMAAASASGRRTVAAQAAMSSSRLMISSFLRRVIVRAEGLGHGPPGQG